MQLTRVEKENYDGFAPLTFGKNIEDFDVVIGSIEDETAVAIAMFNIVEEVLMLDYIYVDEDYRRRGIASEMLSSFIEVMKPIHPTAIHTNFPERNDDMRYFFETFGFATFRDGQAYSIQIEDLMKSDALKAVTTRKKSNPVITLGELTESKKKQIQNNMIKAQLDPETLDNTGLSKELSLITLDDETMVPGAIVLCRQNEEAIVIDYIGTFTRELAQLTDIFRALYEKVVKMNLTGLKLIFVVMDEKMQGFVEKLVGDKSLLQDEGKIMSAMMMMPE